MVERDNKNDPIGPGKGKDDKPATPAAKSGSTPPAPSVRAEGDPVESPAFGEPPVQLGPNDPVPEPPSLYGDPDERKAKSDEIKADEAAADAPPPEGQATKARK